MDAIHPFIHLCSQPCLFCGFMLHIKGYILGGDIVIWTRSFYTTTYLTVSNMEANLLKYSVKSISNIRSTLKVHLVYLSFLKIYFWFKNRYDLQNSLCTILWYCVKENYLTLLPPFFLSCTNVLTIFLHHYVVWLLPRGYLTYWKGNRYLETLKFYFVV